MLTGDGRTPAAYLQAPEQLGACEPCIKGKMRRTSHPPRQPQQMLKLHRLHMDLCDLPRGYFSTAVDEATRYAEVDVLRANSEAAHSVSKLIAYFEAQTDLVVQRVRTDRGGEYMSGTLQRFFESRGIPHEPTAGYSAEANGLAERHNCTLLDKALPMLFDSGDARHGLLSLSPEKHAGDAIVCANDLHNALAAKGAQLGRSPYEGFWGRTVTMSVFHTFGRRVYVHVPGKPFAHRERMALLIAYSNAKCFED
jgi:hypothetical protein